MQCMQINQGFQSQAKMYEANTQQNTHSFKGMHTLQIEQNQTNQNKLKKTKTKTRKKNKTKKQQTQTKPGKDSEVPVRGLPDVLELY